MLPDKNNLEITGRLLCPIQIGAPAFIHEHDPESCRRTSVVLQVRYTSQTEVQFETLNTHYLLHLEPGGVSV